MLSAKDLTKKYGAQTALNQLNLDIKAGEIFALLGQNGAGKTTAINCFLGFVEPTSGGAYIDQLEVAKNLQTIRRQLAYIPETVMLYPNLSGIENLSFFSSLAGFSYSTTELESYLNYAGLQAAAHHQRLGGYSKGMRQKVGIAIAVAKQAKALLLDEPTSGLDPKAANEFSSILQQLAENGTAILMATHDIFRAKETAHRIGIMKEGDLVSITDTASVSASALEALYLQTV